MSLNKQKNDDEIFHESIQFHQSGNLNDAQKGFDYLISKYPNSSDLLNSLGTLYLQLGEDNKGCALLEKSLQINPNQSKISFNLGNSYANQKKFSKALEFLKMAIAKEPNFIEAYKKKGEILTHLKIHNEALSCFKKAIKLSPKNITILNGIGVNLLELGEARDALEYFKKCIEINKTIAIFYNNAGLAEYKMNAFRESVESFNKCITMSSSTGYFYSNRGLSFQALKKLNLAIEDFNKCISLDPDYPDAYWNKSLVNLFQGDYEDGWELYEYRWQSFAKEWARSYTKKLWLGEETIKNKIIFIYPEQGHGDFIQCYRYIALLKDMKPKKIILETTEPFYKLINIQDDEIEVIGPGIKTPKFDLYCPIMSLPLAFKTQISSIPNKCPYLLTDLTKDKIWRNKFKNENQLKIGVCWFGNPLHKNDHNRSMSLNDLLELISLPFEFHCLQKEFRQEDQKELNKVNIFDHQNSLNDFSETASLINMMDIVISVDTAIAHLAGAMGKRTFLLLPDKSSFLWMGERKDSPWYPTIKIFRQETLGDWQGPLKEIIKELKS
ncbi:MAG: tetratricopeptide repeat protein [Flavobacteriaceae bacterium]|nr:tetratricopeptide repeat protein [Flavobacteriaceae bacterium]